jgi:hypothetical protein
MAIKAYEGVAVGKKIQVEGRGELETDAFKSYGNDPEFIAYAGKEVFYRLNSNLYAFLYSKNEKGAPDLKLKNRKPDGKIDA